jgi:IS30 family transposase
MKSYQQLTLEQRYQISAFLKTGMKKSAIARELSVDKSTITRELKRNRGQRSYRPKQAQRLATERHRQKHKHRVAPDTWAKVESLLEQEWSPEQISARLKLEKKPSVSHESIYQYIYRNKRAGGTLSTHLRCQKKRRSRYGTYSTRGQIPNRRSIEERPSVVESKKRIGDWETDTIIGSRHRGAIVSVVERRSKFCLLKQLARRTAEQTAQALIETLSPVQEQVNTITSDNGKEFANHQEIAKELSTDFYFCHPYSAWERGLNENTNGLIRQYFPKPTDFSNSPYAIFEKSVN